MLRSIRGSLTIMLSRILGMLVLGTVLPACGQIFPDYVGYYQKSAPKTLAVPDRPLYAEFGLEASEEAVFTAEADTKTGKPARRFAISAWRLQDSTGALALFQLKRPPGATPADFSELSVRTSDGAIFAFGNYVLQVTGQMPTKDETLSLLSSLPRLSSGALPALLGYMPTEQRVANSERYLLGPVSLERFEPRIPPSLAAFSLGAEGQLARYVTPAGEMKLLVFNYPTPNMARERQEAFSQLPGAAVKRSGPLVAVILQPGDKDAAERLLAKVRYQASITMDNQNPQDFNKGLSNMILSIMALAGILGALMIIVGVGFGGFRILLLRLGIRKEHDAITVIRLHE